MKRKIKLTEAKNGHWYEIVDDELNESIYLPSSTNILSYFPDEGLTFWRENTDSDEIKKAQEEGKMQGSKVHHCIELQIAGETIGIDGLTEEQIASTDLSDKKLLSYLRNELTEREEKCLLGFENFWEELKPITVANELMVFSAKHGYAGTLDWIGYLWDKKTAKYNLWIVDWKISKSLSKSYDLQLVSYLNAFKETYKKRLGKVRLGILQLGKNKCGYSFKEVKEIKESWDLFLKTKYIWDRLNKKTGPKFIDRRAEFKLNKFTKKGRQLKIN